MLDERLTVLTLIRCCTEFCDSHMGELVINLDGISGDLGRTGKQLRLFPSFYNIAQSNCQPNIQSSYGSVPIKGIKNGLSRSDK